METYDIEPEKQDYTSQEEPVEIYSKMAIRGFSIFFSTIFGGVLLMINLREVGYKKAASLVLLGTIAYTVLSLAILNSFANPNSSVALIFNIAGGFILSDVVFPRYFPDNDYYPKKIWKPLIVSLLICFVILSIVIYGGGMPELKTK